SSVYFFHSGSSRTFLKMSTYQSTASCGTPAGMKMPRSIVYSTSRPCDLHVGLSCHDCVAVTLFGYGIGFESNTQSGRSAPERQCAAAPIALFTVELTWLPTSCTATSPPPLNGT